MSKQIMSEPPPSQETKTVEAVEPKKRAFNWTEKRRAAFERCKQAREQQLEQLAKEKQAGVAAKQSEKKQLQDLVKNAAKMKELLTIMSEEKPVKAAASELPPLAPKRKKEPKIVYESESSEEEIIIKKKPKKVVEESVYIDEEEIKPKPVLYYKPKPKVPVQEVKPEQPSFLSMKNHLQRNATISAQPPKPDPPKSSFVFL